MRRAVNERGGGAARIPKTQNSSSTETKNTKLELNGNDSARTGPLCATQLALRHAKSRRSSCACFMLWGARHGAAAAALRAAGLRVSLDVISLAGASARLGF